MNETAPAGLQSAALEISPSTEDLLSEEKARQTIKAGVADLLPAAVRKSGGSPAEIPFFRQNWQESLQGVKRELLTLLGERQAKAVALLTAESQEKGEEGLEEQKSYVQWDKEKGVYEYGLVEIGAEGNKEFKRGEATIGDLIFACRAVALLDEGERAEKAEVFSGFLNTHVQVSFNGKKMSWGEFEQTHLLPRVEEAAGEIEEGSPSPIQKLALFARAEEEFDLKLGFVCRSSETEKGAGSDEVSPSSGEPASPSEADEREEKLSRIEGLIAWSFGFNPETDQGKKFIALINKTQEKIKNEEEIDSEEILERIRGLQEQAGENDNLADKAERNKRQNEAIRELMPLLGDEFRSVQSVDDFQKKLLEKIGIGSSEDKKKISTEAWAFLKKQIKHPRTALLAWFLFETSLSLVQESVAEAVQPQQGGAR